MDYQLSLDAETSDNLLTILADPHCCAVLTYFQDTAAEVTSAEALADEINDQDHGRPDCTAAQLHHATLPRLEDAGIVEYDVRSNTARYRGDPELELLMEAIADR